MDFEFYLEKFKKSAEGLNKNLLLRKKLEVKIGIVLDSVYLKLYKREWTSDYNDPVNAEARIFFSVWLNDKAIKESKLLYNIHAFKLRKLKGYSISGREFANKFRKQFKKHQGDWENVSVNYGPLTLMEGWIDLDDKNLEKSIQGLANKFSEIDYLIDDSLKFFEYSIK